MMTPVSIIQERRNFLEWASAEVRKTEDPDVSLLLT